MTQTAWSYLPNAKHINWVLASVKAHPEKWEAAYNAAYNAARIAAWNAARIAAWNAARIAARIAAYDAAFDAAYDAAYDAAWNAARDAARGAARGVAWSTADDAIVALAAYDDCAYMIESEVDELKIIAAFGDQKAALLLPACIVYNETKVLV